MNGLRDPQLISTINASQVTTFPEAVRIAETTSSRTTQKQIFQYQQKRCNNCGRTHGNRCPATNMKCHNCGRFNHFSNMCQSRGNKNQYRNNNNNNNRNDNNRNFNNNTRNNNRNYNNNNSNNNKNNNDNNNNANNYTVNTIKELYYEHPEESERSSVSKKLTLKQYHDDPEEGGHSGVSKTLKKIKKFYTWKGMTRDVANYVKHCQHCHKQQ